MASTLPADPYNALGLSKDVDAATIKSTYRKLALKCHPDKVSDPSLKQQKQEEFHKIQQAYELIGDEEKRAKYDAEVRLDFLRREKLNRPTTHVEVKAGRYEVRTAAPAGATFTTSGSSRYEERKMSSRSFDEDRFYDDRARTYDAYPKHSSTRSSRTEKEPTVRVRVSADRTRSDHKKTRDREERRDRSGKFVHMEDDISSNDEKAHYEAGFRRRSDDARRMQDEEEARRKMEERRSHEDPRVDRQRKLSDQESDAVRHILRTKAEVIDPRPSPGRTTSRDIRPTETYDRSSRRDRPETVRRSSARPKESRDRDRKAFPEIVEWGNDDRKPPSFKHSSSSPADIHVPPTRASPQRAYTETPREHRRTESSPQPIFRRSETMPSAPHSSSRRKEPAPARPSHLRSSEALGQHEPLSRSPETTYPTVPPPQPTSSQNYYYSTPASGVPPSADNMGVANGHRTVLMEPGRHRTRSPSPLSRPPMGPNRPSETSPYQPSAPKLAVPTLGRSATMNVPLPRGDERGRSRPLYGEIPIRENTRRQASYSPGSVSYRPKYGPEDIKWSRGREATEQDREYAKPTLSRHATVLPAHWFIRKRIPWYNM